MCLKEGFFFFLFFTGQVGRLAKNGVKRLLAKSKRSGNGSLHTRTRITRRRLCAYTADEKTRENDVRGSVPARLHALSTAIQCIRRKIRSTQRGSRVKTIFYSFYLYDFFFFFYSRLYIQFISRDLRYP